jgi:hypothetical protein
VNVGAVMRIPFFEANRSDARPALGENGRRQAETGLGRIGGFPIRAGNTVNFIL